jgi:hypothetical protein
MVNAGLIAFKAEDAIPNKEFSENPHTLEPDIPRGEV